MISCYVFAPMTVTSINGRPCEPFRVQPGMFVTVRDDRIETCKLGSDGGIHRTGTIPLTWKDTDASQEAQVDPVPHDSAFGARGEGRSRPRRG